MCVCVGVCVCVYVWVGGWIINPPVTDVARKCATGALSSADRTQLNMLRSAGLKWDAGKMQSFLIIRSDRQCLSYGGLIYYLIQEPCVSRLTLRDCPFRLKTPIVLAENQWPRATELTQLPDILHSEKTTTCDCRDRAALMCAHPTRPYTLFFIT